MALRCWAHTLPRNGKAARAIADTARGVGFHTDVCHESPSDSASDTPPGDESTPASRQAQQDQQNNRPVQYPRPNNNFQRQSRPGGPLPDSSSSDRGFEQQQSPGTSPQFRSSQGPGHQQSFGGQYHGNWRGPVSDSRPAGPTRWSSPSNQAPVRQHPGSDPNSGPEGDRHPRQPWSNPGQQYGNAQRPDRAGPSQQFQQRPPQSQQGSPQYQQRPQQSGNWSPPSGRVSAPNNVPAPPQQRQNFDRPDSQRGQFQRRPRGDFPPQQRPQKYDRPHPPQPGFQRGPQAGSAEQQIPDMDPEHTEEQSGPVRRRKAAFGKRITPSSSQQEQAGFTPRGRGSANRAQGPPASLQDLEDADRAGNAQNEELEDIHGRHAKAVRGVPAAWRDEIEDEEDQEDLEDARRISAFNRRRMSGEIRFEEDQIKEDIHAIQMNLDPRLDFGIEAPRMSEAAPPNAQQMLQDTKGLLTEILEIENEEEWQAVTEGMAESMLQLNQSVHQRFVKPKVLEQALEQYVAQSVPQDHPMFPVVSQSLQMLLSNPNWDYHKKCAYMQRLINDLV